MYQNCLLQQNNLVKGKTNESILIKTSESEKNWRKFSGKNFETKEIKGEN